MAYESDSDVPTCISCGDPLDPDDGDNLCAACSWLVLSARKGDIHGHAAYLSCR